VLDRAGRRRRTKRFATGALALVVAGAGFGLAYAAFRPTRQVEPGGLPVPGPTPSPRSVPTPDPLPIEILSGTASETPAAYLAARLAGDGRSIREGGYAVVLTGRATHQPPRTLILCPPQFDHEAAALEQTMLPGAHIQGALPDEDVALRIILGEDFERTHEGGLKAFDVVDTFMRFRELEDDRAHRFLSDVAADQYHRGEGGLELFGYTDGGYRIIAMSQGEPGGATWLVVVRMFDRRSDLPRHETLTVGPIDAAGTGLVIASAARNE
jgi:hypothetical protein